MSEKISLFMLGLMLGVFLISLSSYLGEQRFSNAIQACIREMGVNKAGVEELLEQVRGIKKGGSK